MLYHHVEDGLIAIYKVPIKHLLHLDVAGFSLIKESRIKCPFTFFISLKVW